MKAVIFDMDGTILDDEYYYLFDIQRFLRINGVFKPTDYMKRYIGCSDQFFYEDISKLLNVNIDKARELRASYNSQHPINYPKLLKKDAVYLLDYLKEHHYKIALATSASSKNTYEKISQCELFSYFDVIVNGSEVDKIKPEPDIYLKAMKLLGLESIDCLAIEDSEIGIVSAKNAGIKVVGNLDKRIVSNLSQADFIVEDLKDVIHFLKEL